MPHRPAPQATDHRSLTAEGRRAQLDEMYASEARLKRQAQEQEHLPGHPDYSAPVAVAFWADALDVAESRWEQALRDTYAVRASAGRFPAVEDGMRLAEAEAIQGAAFNERERCKQYRDVALRDLATYSSFNGVSESGEREYRRLLALSEQAERDRLR